jgi:hypothetical protein
MALILQTDLANCGYDCNFYLAKVLNLTDAYKFFLG